MSILYLCLGAFLFAITALDIIKTTLSSNGGGKITNLVSRSVWKVFFLAAGRKGKSKLLQYAGPSVLVSILLVWVVGLWLGLFLLLLSDPDAVQKSSTLAPADAWEKLYYAGFTLSTLGVGDYVVTNDFWRIVTGVAAFSGLAFITTSITYFIPVLSAVGVQSKLSLYISSMGKTPQQVLTNSWNGQDLSSFFDTTSDLCQMLLQHTVNHQSYPVIHYFHDNDPEQAITPAVVLLAETHLMLAQTVSPQAGVDQLKMSMLQKALDSYLEMVKGSFLKNASPKEGAPVPDLSELEEKGIPLQHKPLFSHEVQERRKLLTALLEMDGWTWKEVYQP